MDNTTPASPLEIQLRIAEIQARWSAKERYQRLNGTEKGKRESGLKKQMAVGQEAEARVRRIMEQQKTFARLSRDS